MIGRTISHYKILDRLGSGGMGVVYKAFDTRLDRPVAVKFLPPELTRDPACIARFMQEAKAASALDHPNVCNIHEIDETEDGRLFLVMSCYRGETLKDRIARGPLPLDQAVDITLQVVQGLAKAHERGIVHRDIKPANIFITDDGLVKILDFGLAKLAGQTLLTTTGTTMGTVSYMAPEQARGEEVDHRADLWSLGTVTYEMVAGRRPFPGDHEQAVIHGILNQDPDPVTRLRSGVPLELERIVDRCMTKNSTERYQTAADLISDLRHLPRPFCGEADTMTRAPRDHSEPVARAKPAKIMLVVMPFDNLGSPHDEYFAMGITEEISNRLAAIRELGVISRKSAARYATLDKTTRQIGSELGVQYVLDGTIRWARDGEHPSRVRITPELVRVEDDTRLWSEVYDRVVEDVFEIQSDIAKQVVRQLGLTVLESATANVEVQPTDNLEAYHAFLRGRYYAGLPHFTADDMLRAVEHYNRAVELDPHFPLAYAKLSEAHAMLYYYRADSTRERCALAKAAMDTASRLRPDLPEVRLAMGRYYLMVERDVERAFVEFELAARDLPESAEVFEAKGDGYRQQGKWIEAFDQYERARQLSPHSSSPVVEISISSWLCRRYPEAVEAADEAISIAPDLAWPYLAKGLACWSWRGASNEARKAFEAVPPDHDWWPWVSYWQLIYEGKYRQALDFLSSIPGDWIRIKIDAKPKALFEAYVHEAVDQPELASAAYETAKSLLEVEVDAYPDDPRYRSSLGIAYAGLGQGEAATREGGLAVKLLPVSKDAMYGAPYVIDLAHIHTLLGDHVKAVEMIEEILSSPSSLSVPLLKVDPRWNRLRDLPEFQSLLKD